MAQVLLQLAQKAKTTKKATKQNIEKKFFLEYLTKQISFSESQR
jgi:hypothetical protein